MEWFKRWKAKHWDEQWEDGLEGESFWIVGGMRAPPLRRAARFALELVANKAHWEWAAAVIAVITGIAGLIALLR